ncbi:four helix bundle protein [Anatilimnocola sp. NA78]|uniref:four helix bundle protein n=1 Tax=Anatilimnocola sp. NA78 TaxID=3415683 RepID=UPI003CE5C545
MSAGQSKLVDRTKKFALRVIRMVQSLPSNPTSRVIGNQLLRSGTSVGANYRSACRARSRAEFCAKLGIVEEELDETLYWIELLVESEIVTRTRVDDLMHEGDEILRMVVSSIVTARKRKS